MIKYLLASAGLLLLGGAFFFYHWQGGLIRLSITDMLASANGFLDDIGAGRIDSAYARTSANFRKVRTADQFKALVDKHPPLKEQPTRKIGGYSVTTTWIRGSATYHATLQVAKESLPVKLGLVTEEGQWKVDDLAVQGK